MGVSSGAKAATTAPIVQQKSLLGTDAATTQFVLVSQTLMAVLSVVCAWLEAGQTSVYLLTVSSFVVYAFYGLSGKSVLFQKLLVFGLIAGFIELWADDFSVSVVNALVYPEGYKLWSSPLYMPLSWAIALTQLGYTALLVTERIGIAKASVVVGLMGGLYIPLYEHLALKAGWWYYENCLMIWNTPYYIILFEVLVGASLPLLLVGMQRGGMRKAVYAGLAEGAWIAGCAVLAYYTFSINWAEVLTVGAFCNAFPTLNKYINLCDYSLSSVLLIITGTLFWNAAYIIIIRDSFRNKYVEMPLPAAASNLAWEFVWGFMVMTSLGLGFAWGLRGWFFLDLLIFYAVFRYGHKQLTTPVLKKHASALFLLSIVLWVPLFYLFIAERYDTSMGATSAYMITIIMELLYILYYLSAGENRKYYAPSVAWLRLIGNAFMSVFVFLHYPDKLMLQYMCLLVLGLNITYLSLFSRKSFV